MSDTLYVVRVNKHCLQSRSRPAVIRWLSGLGAEHGKAVAFLSVYHAGALVRAGEFGELTQLVEAIYR